ncbi:hypothetical protein FA15DRAFT_639367 [Coprinopsis marcescibilis]|uniref:Uncharacterized protein n=1 Tax=Coprinopsis marcescibilis TaxID=230819 RepID=A0A5C3KZ32_COPMA|nr:hypothetical protein FA15DRAFT_639367 [Coprinopsis marcescibilis]
MHRQSTAFSAAGRASHLPSSASTAAALAKLAEKKKEFDAVSALERASSSYLERIQQVADDCEVMADAGQIHGEVLAQWPIMFEILGQFLSSAQQLQDDGAETDVDSVGQRLVRVPIEDLQKATERT